MLRPRWAVGLKLGRRTLKMQTICQNFYSPLSGASFIQMQRAYVFPVGSVCYAVTLMSLTHVKTIRCAS